MKKYKEIVIDTKQKTDEFKNLEQAVKDKKIIK